MTRPGRWDLIGQEKRGAGPHVNFTEQPLFLYLCFYEKQLRVSDFKVISFLQIKQISPDIQIGCFDFCVVYMSV